MDLIGDIVEKEVVPPEAVSFTEKDQSKWTNQKPSQWRSRLQKKGLSSMSNSIENIDIDSSSSKLKPKGPRGPRGKIPLNYEGLSEAEKIHQESINILSSMSLKEKEEAKKELLDNLDPSILEMLLKRSEKRFSKNETDLKNVDEKIGEWYGSSQNEEWGKPMDESEVDKALGIINKEKKKVSFQDEEKSSNDKQEDENEDEEWEDLENLNDMMPTLEQIKEIESQSVKEMISNVHFPKAPQPQSLEDYKLDLNDPNFNEKLHEKYFPDLPVNIDQMKWMQPIPEPTLRSDIVENVKELRFDFPGNPLLPNESSAVPTHLGLHHHSAEPDLPGYTLSELAHYSRSTFNPQRCIAIQTIGRILYKLGKSFYNFIGIDDETENKEFLETTNITDQLWDLIYELRILDTLNEFSNEKLNKNLSVRNYSIDALWLWKQGGGDKRKKEKESK
ncbi:hypothetical protein PACTADRAFT_49896 [Pachysolen tannophilus NRRL Y-2460]|uniref:RNA polymerase II-associated protein RBA50 n=1 Tax=Pachysolen tannophilus NRRL Y-2460 TaxID=669874 RepID=A0A1E4TTU6_PACTA|nr:hypothetical protein PACTADRAFT_49896 [Pachysolen tannophilus NRRL Y-2460]